MSRRLQPQTAQESLAASLRSGRNLPGVYIKGSAVVCATSSVPIRRTRHRLRTHRLRTWWVTVAHRRTSENIYVGGKVVIIKFDEIMACKQPSNKASEWDGVIRGETPTSLVYPLDTLKMKYLQCICIRPALSCLFAFFFIITTLRTTLNFGCLENVGPKCKTHSLKLL